MARNIHSNYYEDNYVKYECQNCKRGFILGERLAEGMTIVCPYCQTKKIESTVIADETCTEDMEMGCLGVYFHTYPDLSLMLYTENEFVQAMNEAFFVKGIDSLPLGGQHAILREFCHKRDRAKQTTSASMTTEKVIADYLNSLGYKEISFACELGTVYISIMNGRVGRIPTKAVEYLKVNKPIGIQICIRRVNNGIPLWHGII